MSKHEDHYNYIKGRIRNSIAESMIWIGILAAIFTVAVLIMMLFTGEYAYGTEIYQEIVYRDGFHYYEEATRPHVIHLWEYILRSSLDFFHTLDFVVKLSVYGFIAGLIILVSGILLWSSKFNKHKKKLEAKEKDWND